MNFDFTDDQQAIKRTAHDLLAERFRLEKMRELRRGERVRRRAWKELCRARLARHLHRRGARRPGPRHRRARDPDGGAGLRARAVAVPLERGRGPAISGRHATSSSERWLPGSRRASGAGRPRASIRGGEARLVPDADGADVIVLVDGDRRSAWSRRRTARGGARRRRSTPPAASRACAATGGEALRRRPEAARATGSSWRWPPSWWAWRSGRWRWRWSTRKDRKQFGRPIGAYQAVSHRCAQMLLEIEGARSASASTRPGPPTHEPESLPLAASMAKAYASDAGWRVTAVVAPGARRHRLHLGARPPLLPEAREVRRHPLRLARAHTASAAWQSSAAWRRSRPPA